MLVGLEQWGERRHPPVAHFLEDDDVRQFLPDKVNDLVRVYILCSDVHQQHLKACGIGAGLSGTGAYEERYQQRRVHGAKQQRRPGKTCAPSPYKSGTSDDQGHSVVKPEVRQQITPPGKPAGESEDGGHGHDDNSGLQQTMPRRSAAVLRVPSKDIHYRKGRQHPMIIAERGPRTQHPMQSNIAVAPVRARSGSERTEPRSCQPHGYRHLCATGGHAMRGRLRIP